MMPQPMSAGMSGTKMFAMRRRNSLNGVAFLAFRSALSAAPWAASSSAVTGSDPPAGAAGASGFSGTSARSASTRASNSG